jgi:apolipoprotein N-acyltransferase
MGVKSAALRTMAGVAGSVLLISLYAKIDWPWCWLGWVVLVPWLASLDEARSLRAALAGALVMNLAFVLVLFGWFTETIQVYTGASKLVALAVLVAAAPVLEPQFFVFAAVRHLARRVSADPGEEVGAPVDVQRGRFWFVTLTAACAYVAAEWALPKLFGVTFGHGFYGSRLMRQAADIAGCPGLTFVLLIGNECLLAMARALCARMSFSARLRRAFPPGACAAALALALLCYGLVRCARIDAHAAGTKPVSVAAIQANISNYDRLAQQVGTYEAVRRILDAHFRLSSEAIESANPDLIVWPETVYPTTFGSPKSADGAAFDREIARFVAGANRPLIFGSYDAEAGKEFNAAVFLAADKGGKLAYEAYRKSSLFPFTERVPAFLDFAFVRKWFPWLGAWIPGPPPEPVAVTLADGRNLRVVPLICYDALDPDLALTAARQGADLIVTLSNDSWFSAGIAPRLHLIIAAFRSVETRLSQVRATNTGISAAITATGDITDSLGVNERGVLAARVQPAPQASAPMLLWGNRFPLVALGGLLVSLVIAAAQRRHRKAEEEWR